MNAKPPESPKPTAAQTVEDAPITVKHQIRVGNRTLDYTTTTGFMPIRNRDGEIEARVFFVAYTLDGVTNPKDRKLMFSFNGGPGSASVWLHLGALGPKRVKMQDDGMMPAPPYDLVDNPETWLTETDLVFIDPVGTGYSRATKPELNQKFFSLDGDIASVGEFIRMYLSRNERWTSPLFLVGESYGTTRASGLSNWLFDHGIGLNGIVLISTILNFQTADFNQGNDLPYILIFPTYAATAYYHKKLSADLQSKPLREVLNQAESFASNELNNAMMKGDRLNANEKQTVINRFAQLTGLSANYIDYNNLRVPLDRFNKELLRDQKRTVGRLDSRFVGIDKDAGGAEFEDDPSISAIRPPYTAGFNDYVRRELNFKSDQEYYILGGGVSSWNFNSDNSYADTSGRLRAAMQKNPFMRVFVAAGYFDMATPYFAMEYTLGNMNLDPSLRRNISVSYYEAGHMMYIEKNSLTKLKKDVTAFLQSK